MHALVYIAAAALVFLGALVLISAMGRARFRNRVAREVGALYEAAGPEVGPGELRSRMETLPEPVCRYLRYAIAEGTPALRTARVRHGGYFRTKPDQRWFPIEGEQHFTAGKPGFVWSARIRAAPLMSIEARDCLLAGRGNMLIKINSLLTIADVGGDRTDQSASVRWLMEAVWFPYAFAGEEVEWEPIDTRSARAILRRNGLPASMVAAIDDEGRIVQVTGGRYRDIGGGKSVLTPFVGRCGEYRAFGGFRVPTCLEGSWQLENGEFAYVRFRVTSLDYNVPPT